MPKCLRSERLLSNASGRAILGCLVSVHVGGAADTAGGTVVTAGATEAQETLASSSQRSSLSCQRDRSSHLRS